MKHDIIQTAKIVLIGAIFSVGVSYVFSGYWENAGAIPPSGDVSEVVTLLDGEQARQGSFILDTDADNAKLSADILTVNNISYFGNKVDIGKKFVGGIGGGEGGIGIPVSTLDTNLSVTGSVGVNIGTLEPGAALHVDGDVKIRPLAVGLTEKRGICADTDGTLILCDAFTNYFSPSYYNDGAGDFECTQSRFTLVTNPSGGSGEYTSSWNVVKTGGADVGTGTYSATGLSNTFTFPKSESAGYTVNITATITDVEGFMAPVVSTFTTTIPKTPITDDNGGLCAD